MGTIDRIARITVAAIIGILYFTGQMSGIAVSILGTLAVVFVLTGLMGFCPLYYPFKLSTAKKEENA